jgi:hypothetical protein
MRLACVVALAGCGHPAAAPVLAGRPAPIACDEARWHELASSPQRVRAYGRDFVVVENRRGDTRVIVRVPGALIAGTVPDRALVRVVTRETPLWPAAGGPPLPGVVVEPGVAVTGRGESMSVDMRLGIEAAGVVPAGVTGLLWEAQKPPGTSGKELGRYAEVVAEPHPDAEHLANIGANEPVFDQIEAGPAGWLHVVASDSNVHVTGWVAPPPPPSPPSPLLRSYDFSDDTIEGDLVTPDGEDGAPMGSVASPPLAIGCIRTRPDETGDVIGVVDGTLRGTPEGDGWLRVELATPWGRVVGHALGEPVDLRWFMDDDWDERW